LDLFQAVAVRGVVMGCVDSWSTPLPTLWNVGGGERSVVVVVVVVEGKEWSHKCFPNSKT